MLVLASARHGVAWCGNPGKGRPSGEGLEDRNTKKDHERAFGRKSPLGQADRKGEGTREEGFQKKESLGRNGSLDAGRAWRKGLGAQFHP